MQSLLWSLLGVAAGCILAMQGPINVQLARGLGHPLAAAMVSFAVGAVALGMISAVLVGIGGVRLDFAAPPLWTFVAGGLFGATFITSTIVLTPKVGVAAMMTLAVTGQLVAGIALDRIGFLGLAVREISVGRVAGALLLIGGALLIRLT